VFILTLEIFRDRERELLLIILKQTLNIIKKIIIFILVLLNLYLFYYSLKLKLIHQFYSAFHHNLNKKQILLRKSNYRIFKNLKKK
jgi:hypothetical protein